MCVFSTSETDVVFGEATAHSRSHVWSKLLVPRHGVGGSLAGSAYIASCAMCANLGSTGSSPFSGRGALRAPAGVRRAPLPPVINLRYSRGGACPARPGRCMHRPREHRGHAMACPYDLPGAANRPPSTCLLRAFQKTKQFVASKSRFAQQCDKGSFGHVAIVTGKDSTPPRSWMLEDEMAARNAVEDETVLFQKLDDNARFNGGQFRHTRGPRRSPVSLCRWELAHHAS